MEEREDIPLKITNIELAKIVKEQMAESRAVREENRAMRREIDKLKGKVRRGDHEEFEEGGGGDTLPNMPKD